MLTVRSPVSPRVCVRLMRRQQAVFLHSLPDQSVNASLSDVEG